MARLKRLLFWGAVFGLIAFVPRDSPQAEPLAVEMVSVPKAAIEALQEEHALLRKRIAAANERGNICAAAWPKAGFGVFPEQE